MTGECGLKSDDVSLPSGVGGFNFAGIPEHLFLYGLVIVVSLIIYCSIQYMEKCKRFTLDTAKPSLAKMVIGQEDNWLIRERGVGAYQYILFLRTVLQLSVVFLLVSGVSLAINTSQQTFHESHFDSTTSSNIPPNSELNWFNVIISFFIPWLVFIMVTRLSKKIGDMKPLTKTFNRTLIIESSFYRTGNPGSTKNVTEYFEKKYPEFELVKITWSRDTRQLQALFNELEFTENVIEILEECKEEDNKVTCCGKPRDLLFYEEQKIKLSSEILEEQQKVSKKPPSILFLTFLTHYQASQVYKQEKLSSSFCSLKDQLRFAPLPEEILWSSSQSSFSKWKGWTIATICILLLAVICSTPAGFAAQIQRLLIRSIGDRSIISGVSAFLPPLLQILFSVLVPIAVKIATVNFGSCSRTLSHPSYMRSLYGWLVCSTIIFPIILAGAGNMLEFTQSLNSGGWDVALQKWECVFSADTGAFYINLLLVVASLKCQLELHRLSDWFQIVFTKIKNCSSWEQREAGRRTCEAFLTNRNGIRLALADDYVWVVVYFSVWMFFCLTCPIITPAFLLFMVCKYLVAIQNFRSFYTAKHDQAELVSTAAKLIICASIFLQLNFTVFMIIRQSLQEEDSTITATAIFLLLVNFVILIINQRLNWSIPIRLFHHSRAPSQPQADDGEEELGVVYQDDYENPFMTKEVGYVDAEPVQKGQSWVDKQRRQTQMYLPGDQIASKGATKGVTKGVTKAVHEGV